MTSERADGRRFRRLSARLFSAAAAICVASSVLSGGAPGALALFTDGGALGGNVFTTAASFGGDTLAPAIARAAAAKTAAGNTPYASTVTTDSPLAYWRLGEDPSNNVAADSSGNGRAGSYGSFAGPIRGAPGALNDGNTAIRARSSNSRVAVPHDAALQLNGAFTIEFWLKAEALVFGTKMVLNKGGGYGVNEYRIEYDSLGKLTFMRNNVFFSSSGGAVEVGSYKHIAFTYDGTTARWYINGTLDTSLVVTFPASTGTQQLDLVAHFQSGDAVLLDETALYASALSATRLQAHYTAGTSLSVDACNNYYAYADVTDVGNPPSGVASVTADVSTITSGQSAVPLSSGSYSVAGTSFNYRSSQLYASSGPGTYPYSVTATDTAGNSATQTGYSAAVEPVPLPTAIWMTGVEHGMLASSVDMFSAAAGATADTAVARTGAYSVRVAKVSGGSQGVSRLHSAPLVVQHVALRLSALPTSDQTALTWVDVGTGSDLFLGYQASTQKLTLRWGTGPMVVSANSISAGTWYSINLRAEPNVNPRVGSWQVNGVLQPSTSSAETASSISRVYWGGSGTTTDAYTAHYDDIFLSRISSDYPLGDLKLLPLRPNGVGTHNIPTHFTYQNGAAIDANAHTYLDDPNMSAATDQVRQVTTGSTSYLEFTFDDITDACVKGVFAIADIGKNGTQVDHGKVVLHDRGADRVLHDGDMPCGNCATERSLILPASPGWSASAVNGLKARFGYSTNATTNPQLNALLLEVAVVGSPPDMTAPAAPTLSGTAGDTRATLDWTAVTDPSTPVTYQLFRDGTQIYSGTALTYSDTGRTNLTQYSYVVKATDGAGNQSIASNTVAVTPFRLDTTAPPPPTLSGTAGDRQNVLSWTTVTDPHPPVTYRLYRDGTAIYNGTATSFTDTGRTNGTAYTYTVRSMDDYANQSGDSNSVTLTPVDTVAPAAPTLSGTAGNTQNALSWTAVTDASTPVTYQLFRGSTQIYTGTATSFTDTGRTNGTAYSYTVKATDGVSNQSGASNTVTLTPAVPTDTTAPAAPTLSGTAGDGENSLSWTTVTDPSTPVSYQLFRGSTQIYTGTATSFTDTDRTNGTAYSYTVRATDAATNQSGASNTVTLTPTPACPTQAPTATFLAGWEGGYVMPEGAGQIDSLVNAGGLPVADSAVKRNGTYSLKVPKGSSGGSYALKSLSGTAVVERLAIRFTTLPTSNVDKVLGFGVAAGNGVRMGYNAGSNRLDFYFEGGTRVAASSTVTAGTWYLVELRMNVGANPRTADWRIDGIAQTSISSAEAASTVASAWWGSPTVADVFTAHYDDVLITGTAANYPLGDGKVLAARPNAMGTHSGSANFTNNGGTAINSTSYTRVADAPWGGFSDYLAQSAVSATSYLELGYEDTTETCFNGVRAMFQHWNASTNKVLDAKTSIWDGTMETILLNGDHGTTSIMYRGAIVPRASAWTQTAINGLRTRFGYWSTTANVEPNWHAFLVEIDVRIP